MEKSSTKIIFDSNIFIAFYNKNDSLHREAFLLMQELAVEHQIIIPYCVIQEVATVLTYKLSKKVADSFLENIINADNTYIINDEIFSEIAFFRKIKEVNVSFTDIALLYLAQKYQSGLFTFDKQLISLQKKLRNK